MPVTNDKGIQEFIYAFSHMTALTGLFLIEKKKTYGSTFLIWSVILNLDWIESERILEGVGKIERQ